MRTTRQIIDKAKYGRETITVRARTFDHVCAGANIAGDLTRIEYEVDENGDIVFIDPKLIALINQAKKWDIEL